MKIKNILVYIFLFLLTFLVLDLANPMFDRPSRDGGFFLYAGQQILDGKIPYQDFWDSKGPAIFYVNALGLLLGNGSRWGVWVVEFIFIFAMFLILYRTLIKYWMLDSALLGIFIAGLALKSVLGYGNFTEEYSLLFNAIAILLFVLAENQQKKIWMYFAIGALFGLSFSFRANNIGGMIAMLMAIPVYFLFSKNWQETVKNIFYILAGFLVSLLIWVVYFSFLNTVDEMIYASITFNFSYSSAKDKEGAYLFNGLIKSGVIWYARIALLGWLVFTVQTLYTFVRQRQITVLGLYLLLWFPVEILLSNLSGRNFNHYYISWTLAIAFYCTILFSAFAQLFFNAFSQRFKFQKIQLFVPITLTLMLILALPTTNLRLMKDIPENAEYTDALSTYIETNTQPDDLVLTWYSDATINFMAKRTSPVKYIYYPLFLKDSLTQEIENSYIEDVTTKRPELIIDCAREVDAVPSLDPETKKVQFNTPGLRRKMYIHDGMEIIFDFVKSNYHIETKINKCIIFRLNQ